MTWKEFFEDPVISSEPELYRQLLQTISRNPQPFISKIEKPPNESMSPSEIDDKLNMSDNDLVKSEPDIDQQNYEENFKKM